MSSLVLISGLNHADPSMCPARGSSLYDQEWTWLFAMMIPAGSDGEPRPDLLIKKTEQLVLKHGEYVRSRWDVQYHR